MAYTKAARPNSRSQSKRERFRQAVLHRDGPTCRMAHCKQPTRAIDLRLQAPHRASYTADHIIELATLERQGQADRYYDPDNGRPAHWGCNASAGASFGNRLRRLPRPPRFNRSNDW